MADEQHKELENTELHGLPDEETATAGFLYVADGVGSGSWSPFPEELLTKAQFLSVASTYSWVTFDFLLLNAEGADELTQSIERTVAGYGDALKKTGNRINVTQAGTVWISAQLNVQQDAFWPGSDVGEIYLYARHNGELINGGEAGAIWYTRPSQGTQIVQYVTCIDVLPGDYIEFFRQGSLYTYIFLTEPGGGGIPQTPVFSATLLFVEP